MMGVEVDRVVMTAFFVGSALAGACGMIFGLYYNLAKVDIGFAAGLRAFTAAVLGGIGNVPGAMVGGILIGLIEAASAQAVGTAWSDVVIFGLLVVVVLTVQPAGLLGRLAPKQIVRAAWGGLSPAGRRLVAQLVLFAVMLAFPLIHDDDADIDSVANALSYAALALGLNVVVGFAGLLDLGYAAFFAIGAYFYGILTSFQVMPLWSSGVGAVGGGGVGGEDQPGAGRTWFTSRCRSGWRCRWRRW